jgi:hypothetical protein
MCTYIYKYIQQVGKMKKFSMLEQVAHTANTALTNGIHNPSNGPILRTVVMFFKPRLALRKPICAFKHEPALPYLYTGSGVHPASYPMGTAGSFSGGMELTTHLHLVPRPRRLGFINVHPLPPYTFMA